MPSTDDHAVMTSAPVRSTDINASKTVASSEVAASSEPASTLQTVNAAIARTSARTLALYFARPVRLFRPSKLSGWQMLRVHARSDGHSALSPAYVLSLLRSQGFYVISHHFIPPLLVNAALGTVLWTSFTMAQSELQPYIENQIVAAAAAGSIAGTAQALAAAPAENVRILLEGGAEHAKWTTVWKTVFRASESVAQETSHSGLSRNNVRELLPWLREVRDMAGAGWEGWKFTVAKDACGFAAFFMIFEISRHTAAHTRNLVPRLPFAAGRTDRTKANTGRVVYATTLVAGGAFAGLVYEVVGRPFDTARHLARLEQLSPHSPPKTLLQLMNAKLQKEGVLSLFRDPNAAHVATQDYSRGWQQRLYSVSRALARVGPWGVGFLAFEYWSPPVN